MVSEPAGDAAQSDEVELALDPYEDLPREVSDALEVCALVADYDAAQGAVTAIEFLLGEWDDLDDNDVAAWVGRRSGQPINLDYDARGELIESQGSSSLASIPAALTTLLCLAVFTQEDDLRTARVEAIRDLVAEWGAALNDEEKLLGHLLLCHGGTGALVGRGHDDLIADHAMRHRTIRE